MAKKMKVDFDKGSSLVGLFVVAVAILAVGFVVTKSLVDLIQFNNRVIGVRREVQQDIQSNLDAQDELIKNYQSLGEEGLGSETLFQIMSTEYDFAGFTSIMNTAALSSGVRLASISPTSTISASSATSEELEVSPEEFGVNMTVEGSYPSINEFIKNLQAAAQPIEIQEVDISGQNDELSADILINSYFQQKVGVEAGEEIVQ